MDTAVRPTTSMVDEFAKFAHEAVDAFRDKGVELEGNMAKLMTDTKAFGLNLGEGSKLGTYIKDNPTRAAMFSFMTGLMFTHFMKARGVTMSFGGPGMMGKGETWKPKVEKAKKAA